MAHTGRSAVFAWGMLAASVGASVAASAQDRARIGPAQFASVLAPGNGVKEATVRPYFLDREPVTNAHKGSVTRLERANESHVIPRSWHTATTCRGLDSATRSTAGARILRRIS